MDRKLYVPVRCNEKETEYSGNWYWEPVKTIIKVNGKKIERGERTGNDFHPGDTVVIKYKSRVYHGAVVDPEVEKAVDELEGDSDIKSATVGGAESKGNTSGSPVRKRRKVFKQQGTRTYRCECMLTGASVVSLNVTWTVSTCKACLISYACVIYSGRDARLPTILAFGD